MIDIRGMEKLFLISQSDLDSLLEKAYQKFSVENKSSTATQSEDEFPIGIKEASKILDKAPQTLYGLVNRRKIPFHKKGRKLYFFKSEILQWIRNSSDTISVEKKVDDFLIKSRKNK